MIERVLFTWSGGKDSVLALYEIIKNSDYELCALLTTITKDYGRVSMHGVREALLDQQADSLGISLTKIYISKNCSNEDYNSKMKKILENYLEKGINSVVFGDIFLEDIRKYRESNLVKLGMKSIFPIWKRNTTKLAKNFIKHGFKAVVTCVDSNVLSKRFVGRNFDESFLLELPREVDPCGENGEFHTFVYDGPIFKKEILYKKGEVVLRDNCFYYCDLLLI